MTYGIRISIAALALAFIGSTVQASAAGRSFAVIDSSAESARVAPVPGSTRDLGHIRAGTKVEILEKRDVKSGMVTVTYYRIPFNGKSGWISQYVTVGPHPSPIR